jgi:hypothetical protein
MVSIWGRIPGWIVQYSTVQYSTRECLGTVLAQVQLTEFSRYGGATGGVTGDVPWCILAVVMMLLHFDIFRCVELERSYQVHWLTASTWKQHHVHLIPTTSKYCDLLYAQCRIQCLDHVRLSLAQLVPISPVTYSSVEIRATEGKEGRKHKKSSKWTHPILRVICPGSLHEK